MKRMQEERKPDKCGDLGLGFHVPQTRRRIGARLRRKARERSVGGLGGQVWRQGDGWSGPRWSGQVDAMPHPIYLRGQRFMVISRTMSTENEVYDSYAGLWNGFINSDWRGNGVGHAG